MRTRIVPISFAVVVGVFSWAEWVQRQAQGRRLGEPHRRVGREAIIVLGFRNRGREANYLNRYRVRVALRSISLDAEETVLVVCGGRVGGEVSEAELLRDFARDKVGYTGPIRLETESSTTWENIENAIPLVEGFDTIKIASNSLHAEKARAYLWTQRPDLARKLAAADDYRFGEIALAKPLMAFVGLVKLRRLDSSS